VWLVYVFLFGGSIPWYWPEESLPDLVLGLPSWVLVSLVFAIGIALFTNLVIVKFWHEDPEVEHQDLE
jgi:hypothetical protein